MTEEVREINDYLLEKGSLVNYEAWHAWKDLLKINISNKCANYNTKPVKDKLLHNLRSSKHLDCSKFIAPKQYSANCWFNTMFVTFFFSDKGRKFFRFFRQLMIMGEKVNGEKLPEEIAQIFFIFNLIIEASYNQDISETGDKKDNNRYSLIYNFNTNFFIENLHNILLEKHIRVYKKSESGNPLEYYKNIIRYLNYDVVNIISLDLDKSVSNQSVQSFIKKNYDSFPEILILEILEEDSKKIKDRNSKLELVDKFNLKHKYVLDAVIIRDKEGQHFSSLLTCNGEELSFDGASYSRLNKFKWKQYLNKRKYWGFEGHDLKWSFMNSYQMLFYYKI